MLLTCDVLVMGGGATGQLAAAYLHMRFPNLKVAVVEGPHKNRPIVGESLVEVSVDFLFELGLGEYLVEKHYPKYGLTYYFKPDIDNPSDRTYIVDEIPTAPPILSFQINRFTFDKEVRRPQHAKWRRVDRRHRASLWKSTPPTTPTASTP